MHENTKRALLELRSRIERRIYPENSFLPAERKLCEELGMGRGALQALFRELSATGYLRIERGRGVRVLPRREKPKLRRILVIESSSFSLSSSFEHLKLLDGIVRAAGAQEVEVTLLFLEPETSAEVLIERYSRGEFQAVAIIEYPRLVDVGRLLRYGIPAVVVNLEGAEPLPAVQVDFREVGRIAGRELAAVGHRRVGAICGDRNLFIFKEMLSGLKGALAEEDLTLSPDDIIVLDHLPEGEERLRRRLSAGRVPTAFFAARDWRAGRLYELCREVGLRIPEDVSIVSYDNLSWPDAERSGLTTIAEPTTAMGEAVLNMLRQWLETGKTPDRIPVPAELIRRGSILPFSKERS